MSVEIKLHNATHTPQCGTCLYLKNDRLSSGNNDTKAMANCSELGKIATSKCCTQHKPNPHMLSSSEEDFQAMEHLYHLMRGRGVKTLKLLAEFVLNEATTRRHGWHFGQIVYVRFGGTGDYMSNFTRGKVVMADSQHVHVIGETGRTYLKLMNEKGGRTLYTSAEFRVIRSEMLARHAHTDPAIERLNRKAQFALPSLDKLEDKNITRKGVKKVKASDEDLVSFIDKLSRGVYDSKSAKAETKAKIKTKKKTGDDTLTMQW